MATGPCYSRISITMIIRSMEPLESQSVETKDLVLRSAPLGDPQLLLFHLYYVLPVL